MDYKLVEQGVTKNEDKYPEKNQVETVPINHWLVSVCEGIFKRYSYLKASKTIKLYKSIPYRIYLK